jgi:carboxyl-terminal processing protease
MKKSTRVISYVLIFGIVFVTGWESAGYYHARVAYSAQGSGTEQNVPSPVSALSSLLSSGNSNNLGTSEPADLTLFWKVWGMVTDSYVDQTALDDQSMVYGAIKGMVASMNDPYTVFMTPNETKDFNDSLNGTLEGIGAELTVKDQTLVVISPLKDSPAEKAGLLPGDVIYKIDGSLTSDMTLFDAITKIRGQKGTKVTLTILRKTKKDPFDVAIIRDNVSVDSVSWEDKGHGIFYIAINQFSDNTQAEFDDAVQKIVLQNPKGIILDLRYNGGGYLDASVSILSDFLAGKQSAVTIKKRDPSDNETMDVTGNAPLASVPLVVLVNAGSASASEIVAGAIQDHKRGIIMGEQTFGKGSVQEVDQLPDGSSLRITIAKWYTPNDKNISEVGITPDIVVPLTEQDSEAKKDPQLDAAMKYLQGLKG